MILKAFWNVRVLGNGCHWAFSWRVTVNLTFIDSWLLSFSWSLEPSVLAALGLLLAELLIPDQSFFLRTLFLRSLDITLAFNNCVRLGLVRLFVCFFFLTFWIPQILGTDYCWDIVRSCVSLLVVFFIFDGWHLTDNLNIDIIWYGS